MRPVFALAFTCAVALVAIAAAATSIASPLALSRVDLAVTLAGTAFAPAPADRGGVAESRFRPRRERGERHARYAARPEVFSQIHAGFLDLEGGEAAGVLFGWRGGIAVDPHIQIGGQVDWRHRGRSDAVVVSEGPGPGGTTIVTRADLARSSSDLVPLLGFVQVTGGSSMKVIPYAGLGGGVQILHLSAENFLTGEEFEGTFAGFGWQAWAGAALPLSGRARLNAEVFVNAAELSRDVSDPQTGIEYRETVEADGAGMRFGLQWGF